MTDKKVRAQLLDESLEILEGSWGGEPFSYEGEHYRLEEMTFRPPSLQRTPAKRSAVLTSGVR